MIEALSYGFMQKALLGGFAIALICGLISPFLVLKRLSLIGDGLAHLAFGGIALGLLLGVNPLVAALLSAVFGAVAIHFLMKKDMYGEVAVSLILSFGVGLGIIVIGIVKGFNVNLFSYLIGSILALSYFDIILAFSMLVLTSIFVMIFYKHLVLSSFNQELAEMRGWTTKMANLLFVLIVAATVVISIRAVGILLVSALLVIPTLVALPLAKSFKSTVILSSVTSLVAMIVGIMLAYFLDIPPSGAIVMTLFLAYMVVSIYKKSLILIKY